MVAKNIPKGTLPNAVSDIQNKAAYSKLDGFTLNTLLKGAGAGVAPTEIPAIGKNAIINGCSIVDQRAADYTLVINTYGIRADRFYGMATGTAVSAGVLTKTTTANCGKTGHAFKFSGVTLTGTGIIYLRYRMEAKDAIHFKNQTASFSCKVYQDTGGAINYTIFIRKANAADNFSAVTAISNSGAKSVPSATATDLSYLAIAMGDCSNGIEIEIKVECGAITTKNFEFTELQFELGSVATTFEFRPFQQELALCKRYFHKFEAVGTDTQFFPGMIYNSTTALFNYFYPVEMRAAPTITFFAAGSNADYEVIYGTGVQTRPASDLSTSDATYQSVQIAATVSGLTAGQGALLRAGGVSSIGICHIFFAAEL